MRANRPRRGGAGDRVVAAALVPSDAGDRDRPMLSLLNTCLLPVALSLLLLLFVLLTRPGEGAPSAPRNDRDLLNCVAALAALPHNVPAPAA